jgi:endonuclease YncB( thermonuclease family)
VNVPRGFIWTIPGEVDRVHDGDSVICHLMVHPNEGGEAHGVNVRLEGINAPELNTAAGVVARDFLAALLPSGTQVTLVAHRREKYGRFLARMIDPDGNDISGLLLTAGHAVPYLT